MAGFCFLHCKIVHACLVHPLAANPGQLPVCVCVCASVPPPFGLCVPQVLSSASLEVRLCGGGSAVVYYLVVAWHCAKGCLCSAHVCIAWLCGCVRVCVLLRAGATLLQLWSARKKSLFLLLHFNPYASCLSALGWVAAVVSPPLDRSAVLDRSLLFAAVRCVPAAEEQQQKTSDACLC